MSKSVGIDLGTTNSVGAVKRVQTEIVKNSEGAAILSHRLAETYECPKCGVEVSQADSKCGDCGFDLEKYIIDEGVFDIVHSAAYDLYIHLGKGTWTSQCGDHPRNL